MSKRQSNLELKIDEISKKDDIQSENTSISISRKACKIYDV